MKQLSRRSKETIKPINTSKYDPRKQVVDYQQYQQQLASFQENKKTNSITNLFDWTKPSEIISLKSQEKSKPSEKKEEVIQNNSMNTDELLRSEEDHNERQNEENLDDSFDIEVPNSPKPTFVELIKRDYGNEYRSMTNSQIEGQLRVMRDQILQMNEKLNRMLDKYELMGQRYIKKDAQINNPHKFLSKEIEINSKILASQADEIKQIQEKDKSLEKKDYLVELNELIIEIGKEIHDTGKDKHHRWVDVERIDRLLKEMEDIQGTEDEYRQVKELKIKIVFYFKKLKSQKMHEEQVDSQIEKLIQKDNQMAKYYEQLTQVAVQKSLQVSSNKPYLELKKKHDELIVLLQSTRKKKEIAVKFQQVAEQKVERQTQAIKKEIQRVEMLTQQFEHKSIAVDEETNQLMNKNNILNRELKSISYRFDQSLLHSDKQKFKPDFKRVISRMSAEKDGSKTVQNIPEGIASNRLRPINDKNMTIDESSSNVQRDLNDSKLKPMLRQWKGKSEKAEKPRYPESPSSKYKTLQTSNIFKPPLLLKSKKQ